MRFRAPINLARSRYSSRRGKREERAKGGVAPRVMTDETDPVNGGGAGKNPRLRLLELAFRSARIIAGTRAVVVNAYLRTGIPLWIP